MKYAIIALSGKQYNITEGSRITVDSLGIEEGDSLEPENVLLYGDPMSVKVGTPLLPEVKVSLLCEGNIRSKKISVRRFRSKSRYRRIQGHRQDQTRLLVKSIDLRHSPVKKGETNV
jgi:large subunit ribosomal protein L21